MGGEGRGILFGFVFCSVSMQMREFHEENTHEWAEWAFYPNIIIEAYKYLWKSKAWYDMIDSKSK